MTEALERLLQDLRLELLGQLVLAVLIGGLIGMERELQGKPAGLRTNILICVGATLFTVLSKSMTSTWGDPSRIAAQIVTGVGFIGAGTILHARGAVVGLTSAATIWVVAAIGMALGAGLYVEALGSSVLVAFVLRGLRSAEQFIGRRTVQMRIVVHARPSPNALDAIETVIRRTGLQIIGRSARHENVDLVIEFELAGPRRLYDQAMVAVLHHPEVRTVSTGE